MTPEDQKLIDDINARHEALSGRDRLWIWFGLSRASWLTMPRVLMHAMPDDWQKRMAVLLEEYDDTFSNPPDVATYVVSRKGNRFVRLPDWLCNYRYPNHEEIEQCKR